MKIQGGQRLAVQSMGRNSVGNTGFEGDVDKAAGITKGVTTALETGAKLIDENDDRIIKKGKQDAGMELQVKQNQLVNQFGTVEDVNVNDVPVEYRTESMKVKGSAKSAQVIPGIYKDGMSKQIMDSAKLITEGPARDEFIATSNSLLNKKMTELTIASNKSLDKQLLNDQLRDIEALENDGNIDGAKAVLDLVDGNEKYVNEKRTALNKAGETNGYSQALINGSDDDIQDSIAFLSMEQKAYSKAGGKLDTDERLAQINKLEAERNSRSATKGAIDKSIKQGLQREVAVITSNISKGEFVDPAIAIDLKKRLEKYDSENNGTFTRLRADFNVTLAAGAIVNGGKYGDYSKRNEILESLPEDTPDQQQVKLKVESAFRAQSEYEDRDLMASARDHKQIKGGLSVLDPKSANLSAEIADRIKQYRLVQQLTSKKGNGAFTIEESKVFADTLNSLSGERKLKFLQDVVNGAGSDSTMIFQQITLDGGATSASIAGLNVARNNIQAARNIISGTDFIKVNAKLIGGTLKIIEDEALKEIGPAYSNKPKKLKAMVEAIKAAYIGRSIHEGVNVFDIASVDETGIMDWFTGGEGIFESAVEDATMGDIIKINNEKFTSPQGVSLDQFQRHFRDLDPDAILRMGGGPYNMTPDQLVSYVKSGDIYFVDGAGSDEYILYSKNTRFPIKAKDGGSFIYKYDANDKMFSAYNREKKRVADAYAKSQVEADAKRARRQLETEIINANNKDDAKGAEIAQRQLDELNAKADAEFKKDRPDMSSPKGKGDFNRAINQVKEFDDIQKSEGDVKERELIESQPAEYVNPEGPVGYNTVLKPDPVGTNSVLRNPDIEPKDGGKKGIDYNFDKGSAKAFKSAIAAKKAGKPINIRSITVNAENAEGTISQYTLQDDGSVGRSKNIRDGIAYPYAFYVEGKGWEVDIGHGIKLGEQLSKDKAMALVKKTKPITFEESISKMDAELDMWADKVDKNFKNMDDNQKAVMTLMMYQGGNNLDITKWPNTYESVNTAIKKPTAENWKKAQSNLLNNKWGTIQSAGRAIDTVLLLYPGTDRKELEKAVARYKPRILAAIKKEAADAKKKADAKKSAKKKSAKKKDA